MMDFSKIQDLTQSTVVKKKLSFSVASLLAHRTSDEQEDKLDVLRGRLEDADVQPDGLEDVTKRLTDPEDDEEEDISVDSDSDDIGRTSINQKWSPGSS